MKLRFITPQIKSRRATIQKSGRLGFGRNTAKKMGLACGKSVMIGQSDDPDDNDFYLLVVNGPSDKAFPVCKAGEYYYLNTRTMFEYLGIDYTSKDSKIFDVCEFNNGDGNDYFRLKWRNEPHPQNQL